MAAKAGRPLKKRRARAPEAPQEAGAEEPTPSLPSAAMDAEAVEAGRPAKRRKARAAAAATAEEPVADAEEGRRPKKKRKLAKAQPADDDGAEKAADGEDGAAGKSADSKPQAYVPSDLFKTDTTFAKLGLARWIVENCEKLGMTYPTEIQAMTIPPVLAGKNVAGTSKTGSGKTACYCLPILHNLSQDPFGVFALVLLPVRELANQVCENFRALGKSIKVQVAEVIGGRDPALQSRMIAERHHVVVATPGRLADLLRGDPQLARAFRPMRTLVLDEADQLLTQTFEPPLAEILPILPKTRQTLLFSATLTASIERLAGKIPDLVVKDANPTDETLANLTQQYVFVPETVQLCYLHYLLKEHFAEQSCIVFTPTIDICQLITTMLQILGFPVSGLHSLQTQREREAHLGKFRGARTSILVATDVACRGLDIPKVAVVINFSLPSFVDSYVHRAGRTARAGRPGLVVSIMTKRDVNRIGQIEEKLGRQLELRPTDEEEALLLLTKTTKVRQKAELLLSEVGFEDKVIEHRKKRERFRRERNPAL